MEGSHIKSRRLGLRGLSEHLGKLPPQAVEMEEAILGAMMLERDAVDTVLGIIQPKCMYRDANQEVFQAIVDLYQEGEPIDLKTVVHQLRKVGKLELIGSAHYVAELTTKVNSAGNIEYHSRVVYEEYMKREVIRICAEYQKQAYENTSDVFKMISSMSAAIEEVDNVTGDIIHVGSARYITDAIEEVSELKKLREENKTIGTPTGFMHMDRKTGGLHSADLIIIGGRPGMGKTALMTSLAYSIAIDFKIPTLIFSLEMRTLELVFRMFSASAGVDVTKFRNGKFSDVDMEKIMTVAGPKMTNSPLYIDDSPSMSIIQLKSKVRKEVKQHGIKVVMVDYLQLLDGKGTERNREQEIATISRELKQIAKAVGIPVIALSQLSRATESRGSSKRPQLSDLRESGSIEQDADVVMFTYRPEYYGIKTVDIEGEGEQPAHQIGEVIYAKNRHGGTGSVFLRFLGFYTKWDNRNVVNPDEEFHAPGESRKDDDDATFQPRQTDGGDDDLPF